MLLLRRSIPGVSESEVRGQLVSGLVSAAPGKEPCTKQEGLHISIRLVATQRH
ncbi:unnamed protein product [Chrysoparadoxa australica]